MSSHHKAKRSEDRTDDISGALDRVLQLADLEAHHRFPAPRLVEQPQALASVALPLEYLAGVVHMVQIAAAAVVEE
jgi:hypothetical protein